MDDSPEDFPSNSRTAIDLSSLRYPKLSEPSAEQIAERT